MIIIDYKIKFSRLCELQGAGEQQTEAYLAYGEGAAQPATTQSAKSTSGAISLAGWQACEARKF